MAEMTVKQHATKEEARDAIFETLNRFKNLDSAGAKMKKWQKFLFIQLPIVLVILIFGFKPEKNKITYVPYHLVTEFSKDNYRVRDMVSGRDIGNIHIENNHNISFYGEAIEGILGTDYKDEYSFKAICFNNLKFEKKVEKNLEFYTSTLGEWYTVVIFDLSKHDFHNFYKSEERTRYLFSILKNKWYNFSVNDESCYDVYISFSGEIDYSIYTAILE